MTTVTLDISWLVKKGAASVVVKAPDGTVYSTTFPKVSGMLAMALPKSGSHKLTINVQPKENEK